MKGLVGEFTALQPATHKVKENWAKDGMYGCSTILCNTGYIFTIKARNINGTSKQGSPVSIPAFTKGKLNMYFTLFISILICCKCFENTTLLEAKFMTVFSFPSLCRRVVSSFNGGF
jgi:hypothetical protein